VIDQQYCAHGERCGSFHSMLNACLLRGLRAGCSEPPSQQTSRADAISPGETDMTQEAVVLAVELAAMDKPCPNNYGRQIQLSSHSGTRLCGLAGQGRAPADAAGADGA